MNEPVPQLYACNFGRVRTVPAVSPLCSQYRADLLQDAASILHDLSQLKLSDPETARIFYWCSRAFYDCARDVAWQGYCANGRERLVETGEPDCYKLKKLESIRMLICSCTTYMRSRQTFIFPRAERSIEVAGDCQNNVHLQTYKAPRLNGLPRFAISRHPHIKTGLALQAASYVCIP